MEMPEFHTGGPHRPSGWREAREAYPTLQASRDRTSWFSGLSRLVTASIHAADGPVSPFVKTFGLYPEIEHLGFQGCPVW